VGFFNVSDYRFRHLWRIKVSNQLARTAALQEATYQVSYRHVSTKESSYLPQKSQHELNLRKKSGSKLLFCIPCCSKMKGKVHVAILYPQGQLDQWEPVPFKVERPRVFEDIESVSQSLERMVFVCMVLQNWSSNAETWTFCTFVLETTRVSQYQCKQKSGGKVLWQKPLWILNRSPSTIW
jgi:hypothetical protein